MSRKQKLSSVLLGLLLQVFEERGLEIKNIKKELNITNKQARKLLKGKAKVGELASYILGLKYDLLLDLRPGKEAGIIRTAKPTAGVD